MSSRRGATGTRTWPPPDDSDDSTASAGSEETRTLAAQQAPQVDEGAKTPERHLGHAATVEYALRGTRLDSAAVDELPPLPPVPDDDVDGIMKPPEGWEELWHMGNVSCRSLVHKPPQDPSRPPRPVSEDHSQELVTSSAPRQGKHVVSGPRGEEYDGEFVDGLRHGHGRCRYADGSTYVGEWRYNYWHAVFTLLHQAFAVRVRSRTASGTAPPWFSTRAAPDLRVRLPMGSRLASVSICRLMEAGLRATSKMVCGMGAEQHGMLTVLSSRRIGFEARKMVKVCLGLMMALCGGAVVRLATTILTQARRMRGGGSNGRQQSHASRSVNQLWTMHDGESAFLLTAGVTLPSPRGRPAE